ncbi:hypothetical protein N566_17795, partial [Streptomycetaceae bacterium MP113-05]
LAALPVDGTWSGLAEALVCGEDAVAARPEGLFVRRLVRAPESRGDEAGGLPALRPGGTVLIAGAARETRAAVARRFAESGAGHLLLVTGKEDGAHALAAELTAAGTPATAVDAALSDRPVLTALLADIHEDRPLTAVVHTGAPLDETPLDQLTPQRLAETLASSAAEVRLLHELTEHAELDAFVLFSSIAATFGGVGQGAYASANACLEATAALRRAGGLAGTSLAWGPWAGAEDTEAAQVRRERLGRRGLRLLDPDRMLNAARSAFDGGEADVVLADLDWSRFAPAYTSVRPSALLSELPEARTAGGPAAPASPTSGLLDRLAEARTEEERRERAIEFVRAEVGAVLGHADGSALPERGLLELGFDSLTSVELRNRLNSAAGAVLPMAAFMDNPRPAALAELLLNELPGVEQPGTHAPASPTAEPGTFLSVLLRQALDKGEPAAFVRLLGDAAAFRPAFTEPGRAGDVPAPVQLARGGSGQHLLCLPSALMASGPHQFARFAAALRDAHPVTALPLPGFLPGEALPGTLDALVGALSAGAADALGDGEPFALVGYSSGGLLAHAVAARLSARFGARPVVLLDSRPLDGYTPADHPWLLEGMAARMEAVDDTRLTAMGGYLRLLDGGTPEPAGLSTLLVGAAEHRGGRRVTWPLPHTEVTVPGDHFTLIEEHADTTAAAVTAWLHDTGQFQDAPERPER